MAEAKDENDGIWASARRHPVITTTLTLCTLAGAVTGFLMLSEDWSVLHRIAAGAVAGGGIGLLFTATKMLG